MSESIVTVIASGVTSQAEFTILVENGRVIYETEYDGDWFLRSTSQIFRIEISLDELKISENGKFYEETKTEVERQLSLIRKADEPAARCSRK